jgi:hypothetical protein
VTLQNRVGPWGDLHAAPERGTMLGNRGGKFHRDDQTLGKRRWASRHWIACELHYKDMHHEPMGRGYTSLFFLDEVTALAAGHRPCFFCRRQEAKAFLGDRKVEDFDRVLHAERLTPRCSAFGGASKGHAPGLDASRAAARPPQHEGLLDDLPDGTMIDIAGAAYAVRGQHLLRWSFAGYVERVLCNTTLQGKVLTAPSITAILRNGYKPRWHESALQWGTT